MSRRSFALRSNSARLAARRFRPLRCETLESRALLAADFPQFVDPFPAPGNQFGHSVRPLSTGNVVITSPFDDTGGTDAGAVYLFNGATGDLIGAWFGITAEDNVGLHGVVPLASGNFVFRSLNWDNDAVADAGAVTWCNGTTGSGFVIVTAGNSLVGTTAGDQVGNNGVRVLTNGNYVVLSEFWDNGATPDAGAATFGSGASGISGEVSAANSLVGSTAGDGVGRTLTTLTNGNYVVGSPFWNNGAVDNAGAVTFASGTTGITGAVSSTNSLVGGTAADLVGSGGVTPLANGNYVVRSGDWRNGVGDRVGAATFGSGTSGISGPVSASNSLVGSVANRVVGLHVTTLTNGNYVVHSPFWENSATTNFGAVTFGNGTTGISGEVSSANSLVGSTANDRIGGFFDVTPLTNGNYVVRSPLWDNGAGVDAGAVTFGDGTTGVAGVVSSANSLVGGSGGHQVGSGGVRELTNGNYVVLSPLWDNFIVGDVGAATFGSGTSGISGEVSFDNSLIGSTPGDQVGGGGVRALTNGNYVVRSPLWDNGATADAGAATFASGTSGITGVVSSTNSLVGSTANDHVGGSGVAALSNGNYVVVSRDWDRGAVVDAGAATFGNGTSGISGVVSAANSLVGRKDFDQVGNEISVLANGNYVLLSPLWDNGAIADAGAVTFGNGTSGISGPVNGTNSLVGSHDNDQVGDRIIELANSNYVVSSPTWDRGAVIDAGAATFGNGTSGISGTVSGDNSLVGSTAGDMVSDYDVIPLANGNYFVVSSVWDNGALADAGALTFGRANAGVKGTINSFNSAIGAAANTGLQSYDVDDVNKTFFGQFLTEGGGIVRVGSQRDGFNAAPVIGNFGSNLIYVENATPILISNTATVSDVDSPNFASGTLRVAFDAGRVSSDRFGIRTVGTGPGQINVQGNQVRIGTIVIGTFTGGVGTTPLVVTFTNNATPGRAQTLLRNITFRNLAENPPNADRTVRARLSDGDGETVARIKQILISAVNDAPVLGGIGGSVGYTLNSAPIVLAGAATVRDVDSAPPANFASGLLLVRIIQGGNASNRLLIGGAFELDGNLVKRTSDGLVIGSRNANGGVGTTRLEITFNTNATPAVVQQLVRGIRFRTVNGTSTVQRVIEFSVSDGDGGLSNKVTKTVNVT